MRIFISVLLLLLFGILRLPLEVALDRDQQAARLRQTALDLELRDRVGQSGFLAALSGFRSPLAALLWIEAHSAWERLEWGRMVGIFDTVTTLQPRSETYWDMAAWHMAWNASVAALQDETVQSEALRGHHAQEYIDLGRQILENGVRNNPESAFLHRQLGVLLRDKAEDHCAAAQAFARAAELPDSLPYVRRFAAYELSKCPGKEQEAYELLKALYDEGPHQHRATLISTLKRLEQELNIPPDQRIQ